MNQNTFWQIFIANGFPDSFFYLQFFLKLGLSAAIVIAASLVIEHSGPLVGALVVTLPVTVIPAFAFISLDHNASYMAAAATVGFAVVSINGLFMMLYILLAQKRNIVVSVGIPIVVWFTFAWFIYIYSWTSLSALLLNACIFPVCIFLARHYRSHRILIIKRKWYELPLRTILVCLLMGTVLVLSGFASPSTAAIISVFPISTTSTILIIHSSFGGRSSASVIANGLWGMLGIGIGLFVFSLTVEISIPLSFTVFILVPVTWNMLIWIWYRKRLPLA